MHSCISYPPVDTFLGQSTIFGVVLDILALLGIGWWCRFSYHKYPDISITFDIFHYWNLLVYKLRCPTPWPLGKILRALLCSWGFPFNDSYLMFMEETLKLSLNLMIIYVQYGLNDSTNLLYGTLSCIWVAVLLHYRLAELLWASRPFYLFPARKEIWSSWRDCFATARYCFVVLQLRRFRQDVLPSLQRALYVSIFTLFM